MELLQLRYFATVAKYQNISKAAKEHMIPQPAMSKTISNIEKDLGIPLFERNGNRILLNENGKNFYDTVLTTLSSLDDGITNLKAENGKVEGEIKLLVLQNRNAIINIVEKFMEKYPNIKFMIFHSNNYPEDYEFDFCLATENMYLQNTQKTLLFDEEIVLAVNDRHRLAHRKSVDFKDLENERFVSMPYTSQLGRVIEKECKRVNFSCDNTIICDDPFYVREYVSIGMGVAFAPAIAWANLWNDNVVLIHINSKDFRRMTYLYETKKTNEFDEKKIFKDYLINNLIRNKFV